jgi:hypothetical protein
VAGRAVRNTTFTKLINISAHELAEILINLVKVMFGAPLPASCYNISKKKETVLFPVESFLSKTMAARLNSESSTGC